MCDNQFFVSSSHQNLGLISFEITGDEYITIVTTYFVEA